MKTENQLNFPSLSFVLLKGFGESSIPVQVGLDNRFLMLSTFYTLSPVFAIQPLLDGFLGTQADLIKISKKNYINLLLKIKAIEDEDENNNRVKANDSLLIIRAFHQLVIRHNLKVNADDEISDDDLGQAIKFAVEQDDLIKNAHQNIVNALKRLSEN